MRILNLFILLSLTGCLARPVVEKNDPKIHEEQNEIILEEVMNKAQTGDWLVTRGYHVTDNMVSNVTGIPISHVGIYNSTSEQVIEAEGNGVHLSTLYEFVNKSYRLLIIRPRWQSLQNHNLAWDAAEKLEGKDYDFLGTIGFNYPNKYYCSELAIFIYKQWYEGNEKFPSVIKPGELYLYGTILYDSLPRDEF
ncbi:MAG: YiiX/YebB-like N1pC/P60 family cysteine hydrolase [Candidatus Thiodiazotropha endolucinida]